MFYLENYFHDITDTTSTSYFFIRDTSDDTVEKYTDSDLYENRFELLKIPIGGLNQDFYNASFCISKEGFQDDMDWYKQFELFKYSHASYYTDDNNYQYFVLNLESGKDTIRVDAPKGTPIYTRAKLNKSLVIEISTDLEKWYPVVRYLKIVPNEYAQYEIATSIEITKYRVNTTGKRVHIASEYGISYGDWVITEQQMYRNDVYEVHGDTLNTMYVCFESLKNIKTSEKRRCLSGEESHDSIYYSFVDSNDSLWDLIDSVQEDKIQSDKYILKKDVLVVSDKGSLVLGYKQYLYTVTATDYCGCKRRYLFKMGITAAKRLAEKYERDSNYKFFGVFSYADYRNLFTELKCKYCSKTVLISETFNGVLDDYNYYARKENILGYEFTFDCQYDMSKNATILYFCIYKNNVCIKKLRVPVFLDEPFTDTILKESTSGICRCRVAKDTYEMGYMFCYNYPRDKKELCICVDLEHPTVDSDSVDFFTVAKDDVTEIG